MWTELIEFARNHPYWYFGDITIEHGGTFVCLKNYPEIETLNISSIGFDYETDKHELYVCSAWGYCTPEDFLPLVEKICNEWGLCGTSNRRSNNNVFSRNLGTIHRRNTALWRKPTSNISCSERRWLAAKREKIIEQTYEINNSFFNKTP